MRCLPSKTTPVWLLLMLTSNAAVALFVPHYRAATRISNSRTLPMSKSPSVEVVKDENVSFNPTSLPISSQTTTATTSIQQPVFPSSPQGVPVMDVLTAMTVGTDDDSDDGDIRSAEYKRGLITIGFITLLFSSNSPVLHAAFSATDGGAGPPPVLLLNAAVSVVALLGLLLGGKSLESSTLLPTSLIQQQQRQQRQQTKQEEDALALQGGCELGLWKFLGTTANLYGLALTTAGHGALLIQLTTLIVPIVQGLQGVPIPRRIQASVVLALAGVVCFTQDPTGTPSSTGDALCVLAAVFYATYDLRLFAWGKRLAATRLITSKVATQAALSVTLLLALGSDESMRYVVSPDTPWATIVPAVLWSGLAVNAVAPLLQVGGQQAVGPTRCQTIYASQPLWAALLSYSFLGETVAVQGLVGGTIFLTALFLAATAEAPDPNCDRANCEV